MKNLIKKIISIYFLMGILFACRDFKNVEILEGADICEPPCWMNIEPEITTVDEMIERLEYYEKTGKGDFTMLDSGIARWRYSAGTNIYLYQSEDAVVSKIELDLRKNTISLEDLLNLFGEPSNLDISQDGSGYFYVTIFYPKIGLVFVTSGNEVDDTSKKNRGFVIQPDMVAVTGIFFHPVDLVSVVNLLYGSELVPQVLEEIQEWKGYGIYYESK